MANVLTPNLADDVAAYQRVRELIDSADVAVVFQPVIELATGETAGYEALTRFPDGRPPNEWFEEAHRVGLGIELELFALSTILAVDPRAPATGSWPSTSARWSSRHPGSTSAWPPGREAAGCSSS